MSKSNLVKHVWTNNRRGEPTAVTCQRCGVKYSITMHTSKVHCNAKPSR